MLIRDREKIQQIRDFSGLRFGKIYPTDIDAFIEFKDKLFIFIEVKYGGGKLPTGQLLAIERLCDAIHASGKVCFGIIATHETETGKDIDVSALRVIRYRYKKGWHEVGQSINVRAAVEGIIRRYG